MIANPWLRALLMGCILSLPLVYLLAQGFGRDPHALPFVLQGQPAPYFSLQTLEGQTVRLGELRGQPVVLNFWSTWCTACRFEHDILAQAARRYGEKVHFLGIVFNDTAEQVQRFLQRFPFPYPQVLDTSSTLTMDYGVAGVPETIFLDKDLHIVYKQVGALREPAFSNLLQQLVVAAPQSVNSDSNAKLGAPDLPQRNQNP